MFKKTRMCVVLLAVGLLQAVTVDAARYYVNWQSSGGNGLSWNQAFDNLETALATTRSQGGTNEIWIAEGTYKPTFINDQEPYLTGRNYSGTTPSFYVLGNTHIYGGFKGNETTLSQRKPCEHVTILDGDILGNDLPITERKLEENNYFLDPVYVTHKADNARHVLTIIENEDQTETVTLDSLTIQNGFAGSQEEEGQDVLTGYGGGIYHRYGSLILNNVKFIDDEAYDVRDIDGYAGGLESVFTKTMIMTNCEYLDCYALFAAPSFSVNSAAYITQIPGEMRADNVKVKNCISIGCITALTAIQFEFTNSILESNFAEKFGCGGLQVITGYGEPAFTKPSIVENTRFVNNKGATCGGIDAFNFAQERSQPLIIRGCEFKSNLITREAAGFKCTTCFYGYDATIESNLFCNNIADTCGAIGHFKFWWPSDGYLYDYKPTLTVKKNVFVSNKAPFPYQPLSSGAICVSGDVNGEDFTLGQPLYLIAEDNCFKGNFSNLNGGAISLTDGVEAQIVKNKFCGNKALTGYGDAIYVRDSSVNNLFADNKFKPLDSNTVVIVS